MGVAAPGITKAWLDTTHVRAATRAAIIATRFITSRNLQIARSRRVNREVVLLHVVGSPNNSVRVYVRDTKQQQDTAENSRGFGKYRMLLSHMYVLVSF